MPTFLLWKFFCFCFIEWLKTYLNNAFSMVSPRVFRSRLSAIHGFWSVNSISITRINSLHVNTRLGPSQHFYFGIFEEKMKVNEKIHMQCWAGSGCPVLRIVNMKVLPFDFFNPHNEHVNFLPKKSLEH